MNKHNHLYFLGIALLLLLTSCGGDTEADSTLAEVMALAPAGTTELHFMDVAQLREAAESPGPVAGLPDPQRYPAPPHIHWRSARLLEDKPWGWTYADVSWEAYLRSETAGVVSLFHFTDDFDVASLSALYEARGFTGDAYADTTIYQIEQDELIGPDAPEWAQLGGLEILMTSNAILEENNLLLMGTPPAVEAVLAVTGEGASSLQDDETARQAVVNLGEVGAAVVDFSPCPTVNELRFELEARAEEAASEAEAAGYRLALDTPLHAYEALAVGYRYEEETPLGTIVLQYADPDPAGVDLEQRRLILSDGRSLLTRDLFAETVFSLTEATVADNAIILQGNPAEGQPGRLFAMVEQGDLAFAMCPAGE